MGSCRSIPIPWEPRSVQGGTAGRRPFPANAPRKQGARDGSCMQATQSETATHHLLDKVVDEAELGALGALFNHHVATVPPLAPDVLEAPDLRRRPAVAHADDVVEDDGVVVAVARREPARPEVLVADVGEPRPARPALDGAKEPVAVGARVVVEAAQLLRRRQARRRLPYVNVRKGAVARGARGLRGLLLGRALVLLGRALVLLGRPLVLLDREADGGEADGLARQIADALDGEPRVGRVGQLLVLFGGRSVSGTTSSQPVTRTGGEPTMDHLPLRSLSVLLAGAAMLACFYCRQGGEEIFCYCQEIGDAIEEEGK